MTKLKTQILELKKEKLTYRQISERLDCSISVISYYCNPKTKVSQLDKQRIRRSQFMKTLKTEKGGKCVLCGYDKCLDALDFHHTNPKEKIDCVSRLADKQSQEAARLEAVKCVLWCANCHRAHKHL